MNILFVGHQAHFKESWRELLVKDDHNIIFHDTLEGAALENANCVLVHSGLPDILSIVSTLRARNDAMPLIVINNQTHLNAGRSELSDVANALLTGADSYINHSVGNVEFMARIRAVWAGYGRRHTDALEANILRTGNLTFNPDKKEVKVNGKFINLAPDDYALLGILFEKKGRPIAYAVLQTLFDDMDLTSLQKKISRLRDRLSTFDPDGIKIKTGFRLIETIRDQGISLRDLPPEEPEPQETPVPVMSSSDDHALQYTP